MSNINIPELGLKQEEMNELQTLLTELTSSYQTDELTDELKKILKKKTAPASMSFSCCNSSWLLSGEYSLVY